MARLFIVVCLVTAFATSHMEAAFINTGAGQCVDKINPAGPVQCDEGSFSGCGFSAYCCSDDDPGLTSQQTCEDRCISYANCVAYAWKVISGQCLLFSNAVLTNVADIVGVRTLGKDGHDDATCYVREGFSAMGLATARRLKRRGKRKVAAASTPSPKKRKRKASQSTTPRRKRRKRNVNAACSTWQVEPDSFYSCSDCGNVTCCAGFELKGAVDGTRMQCVEISYGHYPHYPHSCLTCQQACSSYTTSDTCPSSCSWSGSACEEDCFDDDAGLYSLFDANGTNVTGLTCSQMLVGCARTLSECCSRAPIYASFCPMSCGACRPQADFAITSGSCTVSGNCVRSPNYPNSYSDNEACQIIAARTMPIATTFFETEASFDYLYVNGAAYDGSDGPASGTLVTSTIKWTSDASAVATGWELCQAFCAADIRSDCSDRFNAGCCANDVAFFPCTSAFTKSYCETTCHTEVGCRKACSSFTASSICPSYCIWTGSICQVATPAPTLARDGSCGSITQGRDCSSEDGRIDLEATTATNCQQACVAFGATGCCEWQTDWQSCFIVPGVTTRFGYWDRYATNCSGSTPTPLACDDDDSSTAWLSEYTCSQLNSIGWCNPSETYHSETAARCRLSCGVCSQAPGSWVLLAEDQYCSSSVRKNLAESGTSVEGCQNMALADSDCGSQMYHVGGGTLMGACRCVINGQSCDFLTLDGVALKIYEWRQTEALPTPSPTLAQHHYACAEQGCYWSSYIQGVDWGYYSETQGDCLACQDLCTADSNCGGIECGFGYCSWWAVGRCDNPAAFNSYASVYTCVKQAWSDVCPTSCVGHTCEYWLMLGETCELMEKHYDCDCSGCTCGAPTPTPAGLCDFIGFGDNVVVADEGTNLGSYASSSCAAECLALGDACKSFAKCDGGWCHLKNKLLRGSELTMYNPDCETFRKDCSDICSGPTTAEQDWRMWGRYTCQRMQDTWKVCTTSMDVNHQTVLENCPWTCAVARGQCGACFLENKQILYSDLCDENTTCPAALSPQECQQLCSDTPNCTAFQWNPPDDSPANKCIFKSCDVKSTCDVRNIKGDQMRVIGPAVCYAENTSCANTCYGQKCDDWVADGYTCSDMESAGCDCSGCMCQEKALTPAPAADCATTCYEYSCDQWIDGKNLTCSILENTYFCDCSGCTLCEIRGAPAPASPDPTPAMPEWGTSGDSNATTGIQYVLGYKKVAACSVGTTVIRNGSECKAILEKLAEKVFQVKDGEPCYINGKGNGFADGNHAQQGTFQFVCKDTTCASYTCPDGYATKNSASSIVSQSNCCQAPCPDDSAFTYANGETCADMTPLLEITGFTTCSQLSSVGLAQQMIDEFNSNCPATCGTCEAELGMG